MAVVNIAKVVGRGYKRFWEFKGRYRIAKGGRASKKSTTTALWFIYNLMKYPLANLLVVRQTFNSHQDSTFAQLKWATHMLGVNHLWQFTKSPLQATYLPTGQKILFRGLDDPMTITSITVEYGVLCWAWFEEAFQIRDEDNFNKVDLSIRGEVPEGYFKQITLTFNPWSDKHWIKKRFFDVEDDDVLAITTNYKCNEFLDDADRKVFEKMQEQNPRRFLVEGLGDWGVIDGLVFENWRVEQFDYTTLNGSLLVGLDFGYIADPTALISSILDEENKKIYVFDEVYKKGLLNNQIAEMIIERGLAKSTIIADSAEQKSIAEIKRDGVRRVKPATKGAGSIMQGIQKLQQYEIIVHPSCVNLITEFETYAWDKDKAGEGINKPIDAFNHGIDALRYSLQCVEGGKVQALNKNVLGL